MGRPRKTTIDVTWRRCSRRGPILCWNNPVTGKPKTEKAESTDPKDLDREALEKEIELRAANGHAGTVRWIDFISSARIQYVSKKAPGTQSMMNRAIDLWEAANGAMADISHIGPVEIGRFQAEIRKINKRKESKPRSGETKSEATHGKDLRHLKALLNWGVRNGFIQKVCHIEMPKKKRGFLGKGRPVSDANFQKFLTELAANVGEPHAQSWVAAMNGMWHSAMRINEILSLTWDRLQILKSGAVVITWGHGDQKSRRAETTPTTPEFAALVKSLPYRDGEVFRPTTRDGIARADTVSHKVAEVCGMEVCAKAKIKLTNHDLRRSFADRWARKVTPLVLSKLMRCSVNVIKDYYAELESESIALELMQSAHVESREKPVKVARQAKK